jgi:hypothetical protein
MQCTVIFAALEPGGPVGAQWAPAAIAVKLAHDSPL